MFEQFSLTRTFHDNLKLPVQLLTKRHHDLSFSDPLTLSATIEQVIILLLGVRREHEQM